MAEGNEALVIDHIYLVVVHCVASFSNSEYLTESCLSRLSLLPRFPRNPRLISLSAPIVIALQTVAITDVSQVPGGDDEDSDYSHATDDTLYGAPDTPQDPRHEAWKRRQERRRAYERHMIARQAIEPVSTERRVSVSQASERRATEGHAVAPAPEDLMSFENTPPKTQQRDLLTGSPTPTSFTPETTKGRLSALRPMPTLAARPAEGKLVSLSSSSPEKGKEEDNNNEMVASATTADLEARLEQTRAGRMALAALLDGSASGELVGLHSQLDQRVHALERLVETRAEEERQSQLMEERALVVRAAAESPREQSEHEEESDSKSARSESPAPPKEASSQSSSGSDSESESESSSSMPRGRARTRQVELVEEELSLFGRLSITAHAGSQESSRSGAEWVVHHVILPGYVDEDEDDKNAKESEQVSPYSNHPAPTQAATRPAMPTNLPDNDITRQYLQRPSSQDPPASSESCIAHTIQPRLTSGEATTVVRARPGLVGPSSGQGQPASTGEVLPETTISHDTDPQ